MTGRRNNRARGEKCNTQKRNGWERRREEETGKETKTEREKKLGLERK